MKLVVNNHYAIVIVLVTFLTSLILVPIVKRIANHVNAMDIPNERKVHKKPIPRLGGLAIFLAFLLGYILYGTISTQMISVLIGGFIIILTGIVDDINPIKARYKLLCQIVAALVVVLYGKLYFNNLTILNVTLEFPTWVNMMLSTLFVVAIINAINLIDGLDGLSSGISSIYFLTIAILGFVLNRFGGLDVILSLIMLGSTLGFLFHNFPPAKIYLGDTGSNFIGLLVAVTALLGFKTATFTSLIIPLIVLATPIFDVAFSIIRRGLKRKNPFTTPDRDHFHHQLLKMQFSTKSSLLIIYAINILFALVSILYAAGDTNYAIFLYVCLMILFLFIVLKTDILFSHEDRKKKKGKK